MLADGSDIWRAVHTPEGVGTIALRQRGADVLAAAWGDGAAWLLDQLPRLCGADDDPAAFDPGAHPLVREAHRRNPGLRLGGSEALHDALAGSVLEQKVTGLQAYGAWGFLVRRAGTRAPGPTPRPMWAAPAWTAWRSVPSWEWHRAGVEPSQSRTVVAVARAGDAALGRIHGAPDDAERDRLLTALPGVGPWTSAETRLRAYGAPDAVSVGDVHLSHHVGHALAGARTDDDGMLELLAPWAGQRQRVIRLIGLARAGEPRRGPRLHPEDHRGR